MLPWTTVLPYRKDHLHFEPWFHQYKLQEYVSAFCFVKSLVLLLLFSRHHWQCLPLSAWRPPRSVYLVSMGSSGHCQTTEEQAWGVWVPVLDGYRSNGRRRFFVCGDRRRDQSLKGESFFNVFPLVFLARREGYCKKKTGGVWKSNTLFDTKMTKIDTLCDQNG